MGYNAGSAPFSSRDESGQPQGYSVDLCREIASGIRSQLGLSSLETRWVELTIQNRLDAVRSGRVDIECSTTTWTLGRQRLVDFSLVTFLDSGSILTKVDSEARRIGDLGGVGGPADLARDDLARGRLARHHDRRAPRACPSFAAELRLEVVLHALARALDQVVGDRVARRVLLRRLNLLDERCVPQGPQRRLHHRRVEAEGACEHIGVAAGRHRRCAAFGREAARVHRILRGPARWRFGAVVRRRPDAQEA